MSDQGFDELIGVRHVSHYHDKIIVRGTQKIRTEYDS